MAKSKYAPSEAKYNRWIKEGRGQGDGANYLPWLTVRDVPSDGRSHRVFGHKCQRTHQLLSDVELAVFLSLEWKADVVDIREQFPLEREDTLIIASENGIRHPSDSGVQLYMSSDFLVDSLDPQCPRYVIQAKRSEALKDPRIFEKLEIERRFWKMKQIPWFLVTEHDVSPTLVQNISWIYPLEKDDIEDEFLVDKTAYYSEVFYRNERKFVTDICKDIDRTYNLPDGSSIYEIRQLLANRCFYFDMSQPFHQLIGKDLVAENMGNLIGARHVSNQ
ncbi:heteromeric transposase endonuclease subunit TnsA [Shewanella loihica]|uniref:Transposon Tn7 transposition protein TnsA n=1 Tax=Shewanella loihica (strain ATCC BAA-1088 / PV-4) TaxID=323850 RepID=A3QJP6_SHELP|nr:heteromeric transposase endonuclease subunit TnsA [Shewanella loihica]ABO25694.1 transposon Tn7 transposition protein TnsA [Shewanella loihica PV-4]